MILETVTTDIANCVDEIAEAVDLTDDQLWTIREIFANTFGQRLSEHANYVDQHSWSPYDD